MDEVVEDQLRELAELRSLSDASMKWHEKTCGGYVASFNGGNVYRCTTCDFPISVVEEC